MAVADASNPILIVEDDADLREVFALQLQAHGYEVYAVATAAEALRLCREARPQAAFIDLILPDMEGLELARLLRADDDCQHMRLVAVSGFVPDEEQKRIGKAGFDSYLAKPAGIAELVKAIT